MATAAITADDPLETPEAPSGRVLLYAAIVIVVGIFATTLAQPQVLARLPLQNLLKNELHVTRTASASFFFLCGLPWYFKPLAGVLTDAFPIFGSRRKSYAAIATLLGGRRRGCCSPSRRTSTAACCGPAFSSTSS